MKHRPVAVPLITVDPFFSVWSCGTTLYETPTEHWSGIPCPLLAGILIDNAFYPVTDSDATGKSKSSHRRLFQRSLNVTPTSSEYLFENDYATLELTFTTPLLLNRPDIFSRPVSYVSYKIKKKCDKNVAFVFGISTRACVDNKNQKVQVKKTDFSLCCGNTCQSPLAQSGDHVMIDWGVLHLCDKNAMVGKHVNWDLEILPTNQVYQPHVDDTFLLTVKTESEGTVTVAYDEIYPIEYFSVPLKEYYTKYFPTFADMAKAAIAEAEEIKALCKEFDKALEAETSALGENYRYITTLAYRQAVSANKLAEDTEGNLLFLSKENNSNGCIGTLDVTYPSIPLFLKYNPELVKGMLRPILKYAKSDAWPFDFTPHDVGQYPLANGQVYGAKRINLSGSRITSELRQDRQMPVEEAGNMLLCLAAVKKYADGDQTLFDENLPLMKTWADYLVKHGYDPENQLCTDDFAGHLARNCNLSLKAILGIRAYGELSGDDSYVKIAENYAKKWEIDAKADHGATRLTFDSGDGWSMKYNIVWDNLLGYRMFSDDVKQKEIELYRSKMNRYGVPLDSRSDYTKSDWLMWSTCIRKDEAYFNAVCDALARMLDESPDRVPFTDWYYTSTADWKGFRARSVIAGLFINLLN